MVTLLSILTIIESTFSTKISINAYENLNFGVNYLALELTPPNPPFSAGKLDKL